jgi:hypothetical protein
MTAERDLQVASTVTVDVTVLVSERAPGGAASFSLAAALEEAPDQMVASPTVSFSVPQPPPPRRKFPWWIVMVAAVGVVILVGGGILIAALTRNDPEPEPIAIPSDSPTPSPTPTATSSESPTLTPTPTESWASFRDGADTVYTPAVMDFDLDGGVEDYDYNTQDYRADVHIFPLADDPGAVITIEAYPPGSVVRVSLADEASISGCENAPDYHLDGKQKLKVAVDQVTIVCVRFTDQGRMAAMTFLPAIATQQPFTYEVWEKH